MSRAAELAAQLESIAADLDDWSFTMLQEAVAEGAVRRPDADRVLAQARRAVEKAKHLLETLDD